MKTDKRTQLEHQLYITGLCLPCVGIIIWILWQDLPDAIVHRQQLPCGRHLWMFCIFLVYVITYDRMGIPAEPANRYALSGDLPLACISDRSHQCSGQEYRPCGISYRFIEIIRWDFLIRNSHHLIQFLDTVNTIEI